MNIKRRTILTYAGFALASGWLYKKKPFMPALSQRTDSRLRVITLEYQLTEMMLQLGIRPVGVADIRGYSRWVGYRQEQLAHSVSVGTRQQPALEYIAKLKPDVILGMAFRHRSVLPALQSIAPTFLLPSPGQKNGLLNLKENWLDVCQAVDENQMAQSLWLAFERQLSNHRRDRNNATLTVLQGFAGTPTFWGFTPNSIAGALALHLGWQQADIMPDYANQGIVHLNVADLLDSPAHLAVITDKRRNLINGEIWQAVPAIAQQNYRLLSAEYWTFGGLESSLQLAQALDSVWLDE